MSRQWQPLGCYDMEFGVATQFLVSRHGLAVWCHDQAWAWPGGLCRDMDLVSQQGWPFGHREILLGVATGQASWACGDRACKTARRRPCVQHRAMRGDMARVTAHGCERRVHAVCTQSTCDSVHCYALFRVTVGTPFLNHL